MVRVLVVWKEFSEDVVRELSVVRTNKEALVFIHDPLYKWALSPLKALQHQKETEDVLETSLEDSQEEYKGNKDVARALMRVKQKLDGYEEGEMRSVHGQARCLRFGGSSRYLLRPQLCDAPYCFGYQKLQKGELGEENVAKSSATNAAARYVILEEMDDLDDGPLRAH